MLMNLHKRRWTAGLSLPAFEAHAAGNTAALESLRDLSAAYAKRVAEEVSRPPAEVAIAHVGKLDPKKRLEAEAATLLTRNVSQVLGMALDTVVF